MDGALWALTGSIITATIAGIALCTQLRAASNARLEAIYESLLQDLNKVVGEMGGWNGNPASLPNDKRRVVSRMLHMHLDSLVEAISIEGRSHWRRLWYRLGFGRLLYKKLAGRWFLIKNRYRRFEHWYADTLELYNKRLGASIFVEEVFHLNIPDPHRRIVGKDCLIQYFKERQNFEEKKEIDWLSGRTRKVMDEKMDVKVKIAGVQMEPKILEKEINLARCLERIRGTAKEGAELIVFPECTLTGYCFENLKEALKVAEPVPGPSVEKIIAVCRELEVYVVIGLLEKDADECYNTVVLLGPDGLVGKHRKLHLPYLGIDRFLEPGNLPLIVYETNVGRIGLGICYDMMFPEHSRALALEGADILVFPANWPETGNVYPDYIIPTRAIENRVFCLAVNRVGKEGKTVFSGRSKIVDWLGRSLAEGKDDGEDILYAEISPAAAREKRWVIEEGEHEVDFIHDRRPEMYSCICQVGEFSEK